MKNEESSSLKVPFFSKAVLSFLIPLLVSLSILGFFSINSTMQHVRQNADLAQSASLQQASERIDYILDEMNAIAIDYSVNQRVQYALKKILQSEHFTIENWNELSIILNMLSVSQNVRPYLHSIYVYLNNPQRNFITSDLTITKLESFQDQSWFSSASGKDPKILEWSEVRSIPNSVEPERPIRLITFYKRIYSYNTKSYAGVVVFNVFASYLSKILQESASDPSQALVMTDVGNNLIAASEKADPRLVGEFLGMNAAAKSLSFDGRKYTITSATSRREYNYYSLVANGELYLLVGYFLKMNLVYVGIALAAGIALVVYLTNRSNKQIQDVVSIIKSAKSGQLERYEDSGGSGKDSYQSILYNILNTFLEKDYLKVQLSEKLYRERLDELMALQAQINPHFLFNTLQTIHLRAMSLGGRGNDVSDMIENLSLVLRYSMDEPGAKVTLEEEITYAKSYLAIQSVRYKEKLAVLWDCDASAFPTLTPKLILQPLLENSIHHGIADGVTCITIVVAIRKTDQAVTIAISDNGAGMDSSRLEEIRGKLSANEGEFDHIGLLNTNRRLRLMFGDAYNLKIASSPGTGTRIEIVLPA
ncbi:MAG: sensor histidine kinase [Spirochaetales bacterium]